jgi:hypothetical protein
MAQRCLIRGNCFITPNKPFFGNKNKICAFDGLLYQKKLELKTKQALAKDEKTI